MSCEVEKWPVDFDVLDKGDVIPVEQLEKILGIPQTHPQYSVKLLGWKHWLENEMAARGKLVVSRTDHGALRILTDAEAAIYLPERFEAGLSVSTRAHRKLLHVDTTKLSHLEQAELSHQRTLQAMILGAIKKTVKIVIKQRPKGIQNNGEASSGTEGRGNEKTDE